MLPVCQDEISTCQAGTDFTLQLHAEIKFRPCKEGKVFTRHLLRFVSTSFEIFFVSMSIYKIGNL